jgi:sensor domain CHASE-containing protein
MSTASEVLVIIVSSILAIFLLVLIAAIIYVIRIMRQVRRITERAERVAGSMESAAAAFERTASPLAALKLVRDIINRTSRNRKRKD